MLMVGLTGGIGAGKSAVASRLRELGAVIIDADAIAREVVRPGTEGLRLVTETFGADVLRPDGSLDRPALGRVVFGDEAKRRALEAIVHPRVRARALELVTAAPPDAIVVNDIPLLVESGQTGSYPVVIVVEAPLATRVERLVRDRGMTEDEARARMAAQASDEQRRAAATILIVNDGTMAQLRARVDEAWAELVARA